MGLNVEWLAGIKICFVQVYLKCEIFLKKYFEVLSTVYTYTQGPHKQIKVSIISLSNTIADPRTMMVKPLDAVIADRAM